MTLIGFLVLLLIAFVAGALGQAIAGYSLGGCLVSTAVGLIGALIGRWIADAANLPLILPITIEGNQFPLVWAILGSALFVLLVGLITRGARGDRV